MNGNESSELSNKAGGKALPKMKKSLDFTVKPAAVPSAKRSCCEEEASAGTGKSSCCSGITGSHSEAAASSCCSGSDGCHEEEEQPVSVSGKTSRQQLTAEASGRLRQYRIEGMDCTSCAKSLENHLRKLPAVAEVTVQFSSGTMKIEHTNEVADIVQEVSKMGYKAALITNTRRVASEPAAGTSSSSMLLYLSAAMLACGYAGSLLGVSEWLSTVLYGASLILMGMKPAKSAYYAVKSLSLDMNVLMTAAALGAAWIGEWLEGATVLLLFAVGNQLQIRSIDKTRNTIRSLMELAPADAWVRTPAGLVRTPVEQIIVGDRIIVKPGEKLPLDGVVAEGFSSVNQAPITGESVPVDKEPGSSVFAGSLNESGSLEIRVTKLVEDTAVAKIIHMVEEAQDKKAPAQTFVDQFARIYTPVVFAAALLMIVTPPLLRLGSWSEWFYKGLELLVVACPCALVISTPVAIVSAIGNAARQGVLIKGGSSLEIAGKLTAIAFDKTGTLTEGKPVVSQVTGIGAGEVELISIARTIEEQVKHPIGEAIVAYAQQAGIPARTGAFFQILPGRGAQAGIDGRTWYAGNARLFRELGVSLEPVADLFSPMEQAGTVVLIGTAEQVYGIIAVADEIRPVSSRAIQALKQAGLAQSVMLTGDNHGTAARISRQAGVDRYFAELLPEDKATAIKQLQQEGHRVAMVGDGINDAPALAVADLGIAMGGAGTDTAMETADIVLMADNLERLPYMIKLSRKTLAVIKQNIWFALAVKALALALIFPGWLTLWLAVLSDTGAAILVILNSMRLLRVK